jgi:hypothetical protein
VVVETVSISLSSVLNFIEENLLREQYGGCKIVSEAKSIWYSSIPVNVFVVRFEEYGACDPRTGSVENVEIAMNDFR